MTTTPEMATAPHEADENVGKAEPDAEPGATPRLEDLIADLDEEKRTAVLAVVKKARTEARNLRDRLRATEPLAEQYEALSSRAEVATARAVKAEVRALASGTFADPADAILYLDAPTYMNALGEIDDAGIKRDLDRVLAERPHLAKALERRAPRPDMSQGSGSHGPVKGEPRDQFADLMRRAARGI